MTDSDGRTVNFKNTVVVITSNLGSGYGTGKPLGFIPEKEADDYESARKNLVAECRKLFGTPFINRVDEFIPFRNLTKEDLSRIVSMRLDELVARMEAKKVKLSYGQEVPEFLVGRLEAGHGTNANSVSSAIAQNVEPILAEAISGHGRSEVWPVMISVDKSGTLVVKRKQAKITKPTSQ